MNNEKANQSIFHWRLESAHQTIPFYLNLSCPTAPFRSFLWSLFFNFQMGASKKYTGDVEVTSLREQVFNSNFLETTNKSRCCRALENESVQTLQTRMPPCMGKNVWTLGEGMRNPSKSRTYQQNRLKMRYFGEEIRDNTFLHESCSFFTIFWIWGGGFR